MVLLAAGVASHVGVLADLIGPDATFWLAAAGGGLLAAGAVFNKI